jgi:hypothetical protein
MSNEELKFIKKYNLTPNQFLYIKLVYFNKYSELLEFWGKFGKDIFNMEAVNDIFRKKIIDNPWTIEDELLDTAEITPIFKHVLDKLYSTSSDKEYLKMTKEMEDFEAFWRSYPNYMSINDKNVSLKCVNKDDLYVLYKQHYKHMPSDICYLLSISQDKEFVKMRIDKFLTSQQYKLLDTWNKEQKQTEDMDGMI